MKKKIICSILINIFIINSVLALSPKREWRSTWFATVSNIDWPSKRGTTPEIIALQKQELIDYIEGLATMNMNAMCFQARPMSDAFYKSSYEPWSYYLTNERGKDPGWDPLAFFVEECHKRGMDCYVWINPYRWSSGTMKVTADFDMIDSNKGILYVYAPGNGLSAYEITDKSYSSVIDMNENFIPEEYYNLQGVKVKDVSSGLYIKRKGSNITKVIIKK